MNAAAIKLKENYKNNVTRGLKCSLNVVNYLSIRLSTYRPIAIYERII